MLGFYKSADSIAMATFVPDHDYEPGEDFIDTSERISDPQLATLFNSNGIVLVGDSIFKLHGKYIYKILDGDTGTAAEIDNATNITSLNYIPHFQHTTKLTSRLRSTDRSPVINVSSSRREFVEFRKEITTVTPGTCKFRAWMSGQAQTKSLGIWWPNFDDEIVSGTITNLVEQMVNGAYSYVGSNTMIGYSIKNIEVAPYFYGIVLVGGYRFSVTFRFVKHTKKGEEVFTRQYFV